MSKSKHSIVTDPATARAESPSLSHLDSNRTATLTAMTGGLWKTWLVLATAWVAGCAPAPCEEYCGTFASKASSCGLGGPDEDSFVDFCTEEIEKQLTSEQCEDSTAQIDAVSCDAFRDLVCSAANAGTVYNCD